MAIYTFKTHYFFLMRKIFAFWGSFRLIKGQYIINLGYMTTIDVN